MANNNRYRLDGQYYIEISINEQPMYFDPSTFEDVSVTQNVLSYVPTLKIVLNGDATGRFMNVYQPGDLNIIDLEIGNERDSARIIKNRWRMFGAPSYEPSGNNSERIVIVAILDVLRYFRDIVPQAVQGHSNEVFGWIADRCGLYTTNFREDSTIHPTSDSQWWIPKRNTYCDFASDVCDHAWSSNTSVYSFGLDEEYSLYLVDLSRLSRVKPKGQFLQTESQAKQNIDAYNILDYKIKSVAGPLNNWAAYKFKMTQEEMSGEFSEYKNFEATRQSNYLEIGSDIDKFVDESRIKHMPIDCGNVHNNFEKAKHQNIRGRATYSTIVEVMTELVTNEDLFSVVRLDLYEPVSREVNKTNQMYSGEYIIGAKTRTVRGSRYYEKHRLITQGRMLDSPGKEK